MITASLVLYNTKENDLKKVLSCVNNSNIDIVYVIDNSPTDKLRKKTETLSPKVVYTHGQGNVGYGKAHNRGLRDAIEKKADYHIVLNPDISFEKEVIMELEDFMDRHQDVGLTMPNVVYPDGDLQYLCKLLPTPLDILGRRLLPSNLIKLRNERFEMRQMGYDKIWNCPILSGCFMFLRVSAMNEIGLFDENFFMYFEDFDLMRRIHKSYKTVFYPNVTIVHDHAAEHHTNKRLLKASIRSAIMYFNKWGWIFDRERRIVNKHAFDKENQIVD